jgi:hypothetical protein
MDRVGAKNIRELMSAQTWLQNFSAAPNKIASSIRTLATSPLAVERTIAETLFPKLSRKLLAESAESAMSSSSLSDSLLQKGANKIEKFITKMNMDDIIDAKSFKGVGMGGMIGAAAIGFVGMFAVSSSRRSWLGPTAGTGGEYYERQSRKDEERLSNMSTMERLRNNAKLSGSMHFLREKDARILPGSIKPSNTPPLAERIRAITNPDLVDPPMNFRQF